MYTLTPRELSYVEKFILTLLFQIWLAFGGRGRIVALLSMLAGFTSLYFGAFTDTIWLRQLWTGAVVIYAIGAISELVIMLVMTYTLHILDTKWQIFRKWLRYCFVQCLNVNGMRERIQQLLRADELALEALARRDQARAEEMLEAIRGFGRSYKKQQDRIHADGLELLLPPDLRARMASFMPEAMSHVGEVEDNFLAAVRAAVERAVNFKGYYDRAMRLDVETRFLELLAAGDDDSAIGVVLFAEEGVRLIQEAEAVRVLVVLTSISDPAYRAELLEKIKVQRRYLERARVCDTLRDRVLLVREPSVRANLEMLLAAVSAQLDNERAFNKAAYQLRRALDP